MTKCFYAKLAWSNLGKNLRYYLPYMLSCILMVTLHFVLGSLGLSSAWEDMPGSQSVYAILQLGRYVVEIFALLLLFYTNTYLIKRRKREFGLYNVLGMEKRHIGKILFWETIYAFGISIALGVMLGCLITKLAELLLCNLLQFDIRYALEFIPAAFLRTVGMFLLFALLVLLRSLWQIKKARPVELLNSTQAGQKEPRANWLLALLGVALLGSGYWMAVTIRDPVSAMVWFFVAVILVILGTYACFVAGSVVLLKLLRRLKGYYYKPSHFISVGSMVHRMKQNGAGLATICILSTMVLVMVSSTASLYIGRVDILQNRYPRELVLTCRHGGEQALSLMEEATNEALASEGLGAEHRLAYRYASLAAFVQGDTLTLDESVSYTSVENVAGVYVVPLEDYNRATGQALTLEAGQALLYSSQEDFPKNRLEIGELELQVAGLLEEGLPNGNATAEILPTVFLIVPDWNTLEDIAAQVDAVNGEGACNILGYYCFDVSGSRDDQIRLYETLRESVRYRNDVDFVLESRSAEERDFYAIFGGLFFLGIFLGLLFFLATALIIYYKQVAEGYEDQLRFRTLRQVGMSRREIRKTIHSQVLTVFFLPLITAGVHIAFAFPMIRKMLLLFALTNTSLLIWTTAATYLIFALLYCAVYLLTSRFYYRIVSSNG